LCSFRHHARCPLPRTAWALEERKEFQAQQPCDANVFYARHYSNSIKHSCDIHVIENVSIDF
jgi:hypothetical protein